MRAAHPTFAANPVGAIEIVIRSPKDQTHCASTNYNGIIGACIIKIISGRKRPHIKLMRRFGVYQKALEYLPKEDDTAPPPSSDADTTESISLSWMDRFNEVAQLQNEAWRQELLSKALAREAQNPGSISPRALWFIGTVDDRIFHAFASLIDVCSIIQGRYWFRTILAITNA